MLRAVAVVKVKDSRGGKGVARGTRAQGDVMGDGFDAVERDRDSL